jgi:hypothetical protein
MTFEQTTSRLEERSQHHEVLQVGEHARVVVTRRGGRILGPFFDGQDSVLWMNEAWRTSESFSAFLESGEWNLGGERVWIAPEIQYHVGDRSDFWNTLSLPPAVDPGAYTLQRVSQKVLSLRLDVMLEAHNLGEGRKALSLERSIRPIADPLGSADGAGELSEGIEYGGYEQTVTLLEVNDDGLVAESWVIDQLRAGGVLLIPTFSQAPHTDYFEPLDGTLSERAPRGVRLRITGDRRYKAGFRSFALTGRMGYLREEGGDSVLLVRNFPNDPSTLYSEEPPQAPGRNGHSVHVYNDGGMFGGFGEMECNGRTIGGATGRSAATDAFQLWVYRGRREQLEAVAHMLLGME